jgi:hypothetical protein
MTEQPAYRCAQTMQNGKWTAHGLIKGFASMGFRKTVPSQ